MLTDIQELIYQSADYISSRQLPSGAIPWQEGGITDPWDHTECAIALDLCGRHGEAGEAYRWLRKIQNSDGSWYYSYLDGAPHELVKDTNYSSYVAVGVWCHYLATGDRMALEGMWPVVERALNFAINLQQPTGEVYWGLDAQNQVWPEALTAASSCIWLSLRCGVRIADMLGIDRPDWDEASTRLGTAIKERPQLFNCFGFSDYDYAVSWFYPVLTGVLNGDGGKERLLSRWDEFVIDKRGCKCVVESPWWVTVAETCELVMALIRVGERKRARQLLDWVLELEAQAGSFWTGVKIPEETIWPEEKLTWVSAAVIIAASAYLDEKNKLASVLWGRFEE